MASLSHIGSLVMWLFCVCVSRVRCVWISFSYFISRSHYQSLVFFFFLGEREYKILTRNKFVTKGSLSIKMGYYPLDRRCGVPICVCVRVRACVCVCVNIYLHITYHVNIYDNKLFSTKHVRYVYITCENLQWCKNNTYNLTC